MYSQGPAAGTTSVLLATGASVNLVLEPIVSEGSVWGAGWYNAAPAHNADAAIRYEGTVDVEMQLGAFQVIWEFLADWIVCNRAYPKSLDISPDGARVYQYRTSGTYRSAFDLQGAWCTSAAFSTSEGSFLTASLGVVALQRSEVDPAGAHAYSSYSYINQKFGVIGSNCNVLSTTNPLNPLGSNVDPIPFWRTQAQLLRGGYTTPFAGGSLPQSGTQTVEWSADVTNNSIWLYVCNGNRLPIALLQGPMAVSGTVVLYNEGGVFDPILGPTGTEGTITTPYMYAENTWFLVTISRGAIGGNVYIELPAVIIESDDYSITSPDVVTNRSFSLRGLGGRCDTGSIAMPPCIISDGSGAYQSSNIGP